MPDVNEIAALKNGRPVFKEALALSTTAAYGKDVFYPGEMIRLLATADVDIKLCREYLYGTEMGANVKESPKSIWEDDVEGEEINPVSEPDGLGFSTNEMADSSQITLDKTRATLDYSHVMEFGMDDQDDVIRCFPTTPSGLRGGAGERVGMLPKEALAFSINHLDSDVSKLLQVQFRKEMMTEAVRIGGAVGAKAYFTVGGAFGAAVVWNDITGSATEAWAQFLMTPDTIAQYSIALRPKTDYATETCHISHLGLHQIVTNASANRIAQDVEYFYVVPARCRVGGDMASGTGTLYIAKMEA